jgi:hypothetical protein
MSKLEVGGASHSTTDLYPGERVDQLPLDLLKQILDYNRRYPVLNNGFHNMGPNLLAELGEYVHLREKAKEDLLGKVELVLFHAQHGFEPRLGHMNLRPPVLLGYKNPRSR